MRGVLRAVVITGMLASAVAGFAQSNELAVTVGGYFPAGTSLDIVPAGIIEGSYAHRLLSVPLASLYGELPIAKTFDIGVFSNVASFSALFVAPGVKLKLAPGFFVSPWLALGGGVAHFSASGTVFGAHLSASTNSALLDFGGGIDMKFAPFLSFRVEARDYNSGSFASLAPIPIPVTLALGRQNNVLATAGLVLRF
jgi:hypothetical protein